MTDNFTLVCRGMWRMCLRRSPTWKFGILFRITVWLLWKNSTKKNIGSTLKLNGEFNRINSENFVSKECGRKCTLRNFCQEFPIGYIQHSRLGQIVLLKMFFVTSLIMNFIAVLQMTLKTHRASYCIFTLQEEWWFFSKMASKWKTIKQKHNNLL